MKLSTLFASSLLAALGVASSARADELCYSTTLPSQTTTWASSVTIPTFQRSLGTLSQVKVTLQGTIQGDAQVENTDTQAVFATTFFCADLLVKRPDTTNVAVTVPVVQFFNSLAAFDGSTDFGGTSGVTNVGAVASASSTSVLTSAADLTLFSNPIGGGFTTVTLPVEARNTAFASAGASATTNFPQSAVVNVQVCYVYVPFVAPFCLGDGSATACPCGNASATAPAAGCVNSTGFGARLGWSGTARISADSLALVGSDLPPGSVALLFEGTAQDNGGAGTVFGDGLRCVGGTIVRLAVRNAGPGVVTYPTLTDPRISVQSSVPANAVRHYQIWYRDAAAFCSSATFNLTQALRVHWQP